MTRAQCASAASRLIAATLVMVGATFTVQKSVSASAPSSPPTVVDLGDVGFGMALPDGNTDNVLISEPAADQVVAVDNRGTVVKVFAGLSSPIGLAENHSRLYVAESGSGTIEVIDLGKMRDIGQLVSGLTGVRWLTIAGGKLWATIGPSVGFDELASITFKGQAIRMPDGYYTPQNPPVPGFYTPQIASSRRDPNGLYLATGLSFSMAYRFDVSTGHPVQTAVAQTDLSSLNDLAVSADGQRVIPASGGNQFEELSAATLKPDGIIYPAVLYPTAVSVASHGGDLLATGTASGPFSPDIALYKLGDTSPVYTATAVNAPYQPPNIAPHGLALTQNDRELFAVTSDSGFVDRYTLNIFALPHL